MGMRLARAQPAAGTAEPRAVHEVDLDRLDLSGLDARRPRGASVSVPDGRRRARRRGGRRPGGGAVAGRRGARAAGRAARGGHRRQEGQRHGSRTAPDDRHGNPFTRISRRASAPGRARPGRGARPGRTQGAARRLPARPGYPIRARCQFAHRALSPRPDAPARGPACPLSRRGARARRWRRYRSATRSGRRPRGPGRRRRRPPRTRPRTSGRGCPAPRPARPGPARR
jgi:hypothetical protein